MAGIRLIFYDLNIEYWVLNINLNIENFSGILGIVFELDEKKFNESFETTVKKRIRSFERRFYLKGICEPHYWNVKWNVWTKYYTENSDDVLKIINSALNI